jgi:hypothetical protein
MPPMQVILREASNSGASLPHPKIRTYRGHLIGPFVLRTFKRRTLDIERLMLQYQASDSVTRKGVSKHGGST